MKKMKFVFSFLFLFAGLLIVAGCATSVSAEDAYVTLDINPSVELIVTPREKVIYANALNEDGEILLAELDLVGLDLDEAIDLVIETSIELGYIDVDSEEVIVQVTAISKNSEIGETIRNKVKEHVNNSFKNRAMVGRAEDKGYVPEFVTEAQSYNVSPGFLFLAQKAVIANDELTLEQALELEVQELQAMIRKTHDDNKEVAQALRDEFIAARQLLFDEYLPQIQDLEAQIELLEAEITDLEAQIELGEGDVVALEAELALAVADLETLQADFDALKTEFKGKLAELRDEFHAETEAMKNEIREMHQHRKDMYKDAVNEFKDEMEARKSEMQDRIDEFQKNRP